MFPINEIFESVQGEATFTGTPALFIRFQGCPVGCGWCDTKHTWAVGVDDEISTLAMKTKEQDAPTYAMMTMDELLKTIASYKSRHVVLTGGEPCLYDLWMLCHHIDATGKTVQIETSGTAEIKAPASAFVTVSPKLDMPGNRPVLSEALERADEIKYPVGKQSDIEKLQERVIPEIDPHTPIWLQPLSQNKTATALCVKAATEHGWNISIQTHKFIGVR